MRLERIKGGIRKLTYNLCKGGMFFAIPLMLLTTLDVIGRSFFSKPIPGTIEISEYLLSIIILLGVAYTQQVKGHVGVDILIGRVSSRKRKLVQLTTTLLCILIVLLLTVEGLKKALEEKTVSDMLRIPQKPFRFLVFVGGSLLILEFLADIFEIISAKKEKS